MKLIMAEDQAAPTSNVRVEAGFSGEAPAFRSRAMADAFVHRRIGGASKLPEPARGFRALSVVQVAAEHLEADGVRTRSMSAGEIIGQAMQRSGPGSYATHGHR